MDPEPPDPALPEALRAVLARYTFTATFRASDGWIGVFLTETGERVALLLARGPERGTVVWRAGVPPRDLAPHYVTEHAAEIIARGTSDEHGSITHEGRVYRITSVFDGGRMVARAIAT